MAEAPSRFIEKSFKFVQIPGFVMPTEAAELQPPQKTLHLSPTQSLTSTPTTLLATHTSKTYTLHNPTFSPTPNFIFTPLPATHHTLVVIANTDSCDLGLVVCTEVGWENWELDEGHGIVLPIGDAGEDLTPAFLRVLYGLFELTGKDPVVAIGLSDGTAVGYKCCFEEGFDQWVKPKNIALEKEEVAKNTLAKDSTDTPVNESEVTPESTPLRVEEAQPKKKVLPVTSAPITNTLSAFSKLAGDSLAGQTGDSLGKHNGFGQTSSDSGVKQSTFGHAESLISKPAALGSFGTPSTSAFKAFSSSNSSTPSAFGAVPAASNASVFGTQSKSTASSGFSFAKAAAKKPEENAKVVDSPPNPFLSKPAIKPVDNLGTKESTMFKVATPAVKAQAPIVKQVYSSGSGSVKTTPNQKQLKSNKATTTAAKKIVVVAKPTNLQLFENYFLKTVQDLSSLSKVSSNYSVGPSSVKLLNIPTQILEPSNLYEDSERLKHSFKSLLDSIKEWPSDPSSVTKVKGVRARLSPEAILQQQALLFKKQNLESSLESCRIKLSKTTKGSSLARVKETASQIRRSISVVDGVVMALAAEIDGLAIDSKYTTGRSFKLLAAGEIVEEFSFSKNSKLRGKSSGVFGLKPDDFFVEDFEDSEDPEIEAGSSKALEDATKSRNAIIEKIKATGVKVVKVNGGGAKTFAVDEWKRLQEAMQVIENEIISEDESEECSEDNEEKEVFESDNDCYYSETEEFVEEQDYYEEEVFSEESFEIDAQLEEQFDDFLNDSAPSITVASNSGESYASNATISQTSASNAFFAQVTKPSDSFKPNVGAFSGFSFGALPSSISPVVTKDSTPFSFSPVLSSATIKKADSIPSKFSFTMKSESSPATVSAPPSAQPSKFSFAATKIPEIVPTISKVKAEANNATLSVKDNEPASPTKISSPAKVATASPIKNFASPADDTGSPIIKVSPPVKVVTSLEVEDFIVCTPNRIVESLESEVATTPAESPVLFSEKVKPLSPQVDPARNETENLSFSGDNTFSVTELGNDNSNVETAINLARIPLLSAAEKIESDDDAMEADEEEVLPEAAAGLGFGGVSATPKNAVNPMFNVPAPSNNHNGGSFGSSGFGNTVSSSPFGGETQAFVATAFGQSAATATPQNTNNPAFGQSAGGAFGSTGFVASGSSPFGSSSGPAFGQSSFGQSSFGQSSTSTPAFKPSTTAFAAHSSTAPVSFATMSQNAKAQPKNAFAASGTGGFGQSGFGSGSGDAFGSSSFTSTQEKSSAFGGSTFQQQQSTFSTPQQSSFGATQSPRQSAFASAQSPQQQSAFGQNSFASQPQSSFGSGFQGQSQHSAFGGQPQASVFGAQPQQQNAFGGGPSAFGSSQPGFGGSFGSGKGFGATPAVPFGTSKAESIFSNFSGHRG